MDGAGRGDPYGLRPRPLRYRESFELAVLSFEKQHADGKAFPIRVLCVIGFLKLKSYCATPMGTWGASSWSFARASSMAFSFSDMYSACSLPPTRKTGRK